MVDSSSSSTTRYTWLVTPVTFTVRVRKHTVDKLGTVSSEIGSNPKSRKGRSEADSFHSTTSQIAVLEVKISGPVHIMQAFTNKLHIAWKRALFAKPQSCFAFWPLEKVGEISPCPGLVLSLSRSQHQKQITRSSRCSFSEAPTPRRLHMRCCVAVSWQSATDHHRGLTARRASHQTQSDRAVAGCASPL